MGIVPDPRLGVACVLAADWSGSARRRAVYRAQGGSAPALEREPPPPGGWDLLALLERARALRDRLGAGVLIAIDAVLGVPTRFARQVGAGGFLECVAWLARCGALEHECASPELWSPQRPFFRIPAGAGGRRRFEAAAGGSAGLLRQVDAQLHARPVFALSGIPGSVGSGSRALWRELAPQLARGARDFAVWPFEPVELPPPAGRIALAEAYPRAAYAVALAPELPARLAPLAKGRAEVRARALAQLHSSPWVLAAGVALDDLAPARADPDLFDALLTAAALLRLVVAGQPLAGPPIDARVEGAILPTGGLALPG
jgi:hypothetical protein